MALGIAGLIQNIGETLGLLPSKLGIKYPGMESALPGGVSPPSGTILSQIDPSKWNKSFPYAFTVLNGGLSFSTFELPLNPSDLSQDENFSISLQKTQGGTVVKRGGSRYKDLVIKGTTGIAPFRGAGGVARSTGEAIFAPKGLKYHSGYEVFLQLRNWFRAYDQYKAQQATGVARLCFQNFKDGEFLIVELVKFQMQKSAQRRMLYDYVLNFNVIGMVNFQPPADTRILGGLDDAIDSAKENIDIARGGFLRAQDILRQVEGTYENSVLEVLRKTTLALKAAKGVEYVFADVSNAALNNTVFDAAAVWAALSALTTLDDVDTIRVRSGLQRAAIQARNSGKSPAEQQQSQKQLLLLGSKSDLLMKVGIDTLPVAAINTLNEDVETAKKLPRSFYSDALANLKRVRDNAVDKFNLGSAVYDAQSQRTSTITVDSNKTATDAEIELLDAFNSAIRGYEQILASSLFFTETYADRIDALQTAFSDDLSIVVQPAMRTVFLDQDIDLERLALRELGDSGRWVEIAILNNLEAPYIIQDRSDSTPRVKHPGDSILIPAPISSGFSATPSAHPSYFTENLTEIEKNLGVDLKLDDNFDLVMTNHGDLALAVGRDNAAQAIKLKLFYEPGDLIKHPTIGVGVSPGIKFPTLSDIKTSLISSFTQDTRFDSIKNLAIVRSGGTLSMDFQVFLKNVDIPIPVSVPV